MQLNKKECVSEILKYVFAIPIVCVSDLHPVQMPDCFFPPQVDVRVAHSWPSCLIL